MIDGGEIHFCRATVIPDYRIGGSISLAQFKHQTLSIIGGVELPASCANVIFVIVSERGDPLIGRIVATRASIVLIPTDCGTGRRLPVVVNKVMVERRDLLIGRIVATRASIVLIPTDCGTGRLLRVVMNKVMVERRNLLISSIVATGASIVLIPTDCGTGRILRGMVNVVMVGRRNLFISGIVATGAGVVSLPAVLCTGSGLPVVVNKVVAERGYLFISGIVATRTSLVRIPTDSRTRNSLRVVVYDIMSERGNFGRLRFVTFGASTRFFAGTYTGRLRGSGPVSPAVSMPCGGYAVDVMPPITVHRRFGLAIIIAGRVGQFFVPSPIHIPLQSLASPP